MTTAQQVPQGSTSPRPYQCSPQRPAGPVRRALVQARLETRVILRNGEQFMVAILIPAAVLVALALAPLPAITSTSARAVDLAVPGALAVALVSSAFTSQAISTGFDRRGGVLRHAAVTPLGLSGYLAGKILAVLAVQVIQIVVLAALGLALGWHPVGSAVALAVIGWVLGTIAFVSLALLMAGTLRWESTLALANIVFLALAALGGLALPVTSLPSWLADIALVLPSGPLGELLRAGLAGTPVSWWHVVVLALWAGVAPYLAKRFFRWTS